jgi:hypothetical protein
MMKRLSRPVVASLVVLVVIAFVALVTGLLGLSSDEAVAEETTTSAESALKSLPDEPAPGVSAAPAEAGGEPFRLCETCHPDYEQMPPQTEDLIFDHWTHTGQEIKCVTCHEPPLGHFSAPAPMMMTCLSCHQGETAPNACKNCHRKIEEIAPGLDEPSAHVEVDAHARETCEKCHDVEQWCEQCHGVVMPHPVNWEATHGKAAGRTGEDCSKCHQAQDQTFCIRCHGVDMPHPAYWYSNHGDIVRSNPESCDNCHPSAPDFCDSCHHAGYDRTLEWSEEGHGAAVDANGTGRCFVCHEQSFCEDCHRPGRFVKP